MYFQSPLTSKGHRIILVITDYFSKWAEAIPLKEVKTSDVIKLVKHHVIYEFSVPRRIIHHNGPQFVSQAFQRFCNKFRIQNVSSTAYYTTANDLADAFNKTIDKLLKKSVSKRSTRLGREARRMPLGLPYNGENANKCYAILFWYGCEAILSLEI